MTVDQIIQTARTHLDALLERTRAQSAELTRTADGAEYAEVRQALEDCARSLEAVRDRLANFDTSQQGNEP